MLAINNLSYYIGSRPIYEDANLHIKPKDKIGLIGLNGTGKTTLLRLINGEYTIDGGEISKANDCSVGYLNQDLLSFQSDDSILNVAMQAFEEALKIEHKIEKVLKQMETDYDDSLIDKLAKLQEKFEMMEGYALQAKAEEILEGIGFSTSDLKRPLREFSGGWRMRVMLAKLLLEKPSLLMLDEPTNHLDLPSIQWIENYLRSYEGAVIVVSHDRQFLDNTITSIVEVANQQLNVYAGNYSFYLEERELRREIQQNAYENQQQKIRQTERFIERFRAKSTKAKQVQSRVKALDRLDKVDEVVDENASVNFRFNFKKQSGRFVVELNNVSKSYGDLQILKNTSRIIERGDKIALIGANGKGKSTLLRIVAGTEPIQGESKLGYNVDMGFFAQHQLEALYVDNDMLTELKQAGSDKTEQQLRNVLGCFLFSDEEVFKRIKVLSGGEKSRVALAKTLIGEANFLLLDEPTNHLDMQSVNILIQALQQYQGTFIIVSHDRYFISEVANKIWYIEDQEIKEYPGTYEEYAYWQSQQEARPFVQPEVKHSPVQQVPVKPASPKTDNKKHDDIRESQKELKRIQSELEKVESKVMNLEEQKSQLEQELAKPTVFGNVDLLAEHSQKFDAVEKQLEDANQVWESLALKIEEIEKNLN
ncbi:ABC-F family ATP-binding cassette domain-containing protein [Catalinimonas niigatensis]|uniref:ABC-F family ATP-binding cassette domain-containing protein n=1 Tax=Catalinimonas niigatensis TaxID=1397264 RepID=UPI00266644F4|nr:ABC-F family ATP-binding cassette domain-containing protein [Catalinimonas niigatensis]WPP49460.1 ABC-F family ATP-binding cassette domain-containing protein [Catalinimonas niigatensis]